MKIEVLFYEIMVENRKERVGIGIIIVEYYK